MTWSEQRDEEQAQVWKRLLQRAGHDKKLLEEACCLAHRRRKLPDQTLHSYLCTPVDATELVKAIDELKGQYSKKLTQLHGPSPLRRSSFSYEGRGTRGAG